MVAEGLISKGFRRLILAEWWMNEMPLVSSEVAAGEQHALVQVRAGAMDRAVMKFGKLGVAAEMMVPAGVAGIDALAAGLVELGMWVEKPEVRVDVAVEAGSFRYLMVGMPGVGASKVMIAVH